MNNDYFRDEISQKATQYFIFDTGSKDHRDIDYEIYTWNKHKYNQVKENDLFVYRQPQKISASKKFNFFGAGKIRKISEVNPKEKNWGKNGDLVAQISKPVHFEKPIYQDQIRPSDLNDPRKIKKDNWERFFNNYGMNKISRADFIFLLDKGLGDEYENDEKLNQIRIETHKGELEEDYSVEDSSSTVKNRGKYQKIFREKILPNYNDQCAITGIKTPSLLTAAHILKWSENKKQRMNPQNGICLSKLVDKCFEDGIIKINKNYKVVLSEDIIKDAALFKDLKKYSGKKIKLPKIKKFQPNVDFLQTHWDKFEK